MDLAYATLMEKCPDGTYLYSPPNSKVFHPGSCGYFDDDGLWRLFTDLADTKDPDYQPPIKPLVLEDPTTCTWKKQLSENHEGRGFGGKAEVSGIAAQAPVDVGANFALGSTANLRAGVAVSPHVIHHYFNTKALPIIVKWIGDNMAAMIGNHPQQIKDYGVWVIMDTWVTEECDIAMWNKTGSTIDLGAELGATNIGKLGLTTSRDSQSDMNQHRIYNVCKLIPIRQLSLLRTSRNLEDMPSLSRVYISNRARGFGGRRYVTSSFEGFFCRSVTWTFLLQVQQS